MNVGNIQNEADVNNFSVKLTTQALLYKEVLICRSGGRKHSKKDSGDESDDSQPEDSPMSPMGKCESFIQALVGVCPVYVNEFFFNHYRQCMLNNLTYDFAYAL